jgi:hypothetical protein
MSSMRAAITLDKNGYRTAPIYPRQRTYRPHFVPEGTTTMLGVQVVSGPEAIRFTIVEGPHRVGVGVVLEPGV